MNFKSRYVAAALIVCIATVIVFITDAVSTDKYVTRHSEAEQAEDDEISEEAVYSGLTEIEPTGATEYVSELGGPECIVKPAEIILEEVSAKLTDTEFTYGKITVILPEKCSLEYQEGEDGAVRVCLSAKENPSFLRKMYFTHYKVKWDEPWELVLTAFQLSGQERVEWFSIQSGTDPEDRSFGVQAEDRENRRYFYVLVCEEDLYLLEDEGTDSFSFRFEDWGDGRNLKWSDSGKDIIRARKDFIYRLGDKDSMAFLLCVDKEEEEQNLLFQGGNFEKPVQILDGHEYQCGDINFDGYPDIKIYDKEKEESSYFLWDASKNLFIEAVVPEVGYFFFDNRLDDFQTIWDYNDSWDSQGQRQMTESLYRWEGTTLEEIRRISCRIGEDEVTITLTDEKSGECLETGTFQRKGWETNPEVRELYIQFYKGYAPEELYYMRHDAPGEEEVIPDSLVKALARAIEKGTDSELLESLETGRELSEDEKREAGLKSADIAAILGVFEGNYSGYLVMTLADLDNDGCEDIFSETYYGGSGGFADYILYQGNVDGEYQRTGLGSGEYVWWYSVICWEGKNYVCRNERDSGSKLLSGKVLEGYQDGELAETVWLNLVPEKQKVSVTFCQEGYREIAEKERQKASEIHEQTDIYDIVIGDAEQRTKNTEEKNVFFSDIDNDGVIERYKKYIWTASSIGLVDCLSFEMEESEKEEVVIAAIWDNDGCPIMLWVDAYNGENIVNIMYRTGLYDYEIDGFLVENTGTYSTLYTIEGKAELAVEAIRVKEMPGKRHRMP